MSALARFTSFNASSGPGGLRRLPRRRAPRPMLRALLMALGAVGLAAGGLTAAAGLVAPPAASAEAQGTVATGRRWIEIRRPLALFDLAGTELSKLPGTYRARRSERDGAREDVMTFGRLGGAEPYLQVSLLRAGTGEPGGSGDAADGLADGLARLAGTRGLTVTRVRPTAAMDTRLGRFEAADLLLWDADAATPCLGFRGGSGGVLGVSGFACGAPGHPMGRAALACAIDRIDLLSAGDDAPLRAVFVAAERRGGGTCLGAPSLAAGRSAGRTLGWLDPDAELPPLRGLFAATIRQR